MIILTKEIENEIAQMKSVEELRNRFTPEELKELAPQMLEKTAELQRETKGYEESIARNKQLFLKQYGPKPMVTMALVGEDEVNVVLFINGEINIYPEIVSIHDGLELIDLIGNLLHIPEKRQRVDSQLTNYGGFINRTPLSLVDCRMYARKVTKWLCDDVQPKPRIYWPGKTLFSIMDRILKGVGI